MSHNLLNRRRFIEAAAGGAALTAGCTGRSQSGGSSSGADDPEAGVDNVKITAFPLNVDGLTSVHVDRSGKLEEELDEFGVDHELQTTFEGPPLFVSGQTDVAFDISALEAARLTQEQDMDLAVFGRIQTAFMGMHVVPGSKWDITQSGSVQETMNIADEEDNKIGILGWGVGDVPPQQLILQRLYNKEFYQDNNDFQVITSGPPVMPKLIVDGELSMGSISATHGAADQLLNDELKPLYFGADICRQQGWGTPPLSDLVTTQEFLENNRETCEAILRAVNRGTDWVFNDAVNEVPNDPKLRELMITEDPDAAEYAVRYHTEPGTKYSPKGPTLWEENGVTDDWIEDTKRLLQNAEEVNQLDSGWDDKLEFVQF